jgi:LuxR family transcriptional regulator, maltose regulon positive regulatory protein
LWHQAFGRPPTTRTVISVLTDPTMTTTSPATAGGRGIVVPRPELRRQLATDSRLIVLSAPAGSGKTWLLRDWVAEVNQAQNVAWVSVERQEHDPTRFWFSVVEALRGTSAGSAAVSEMEPTPGLDGEGVVRRLADELRSLQRPLLLVIDDLHELCPASRRQLESFFSLAPPRLRFALATRSDLPAGLHRLRLEGEVNELRADDLRFSIDEARALFQAAGVSLSKETLEGLHERTEGWAAGLRLAALSLADHPDPDGFATEFHGSERTVADYLLAEVLDHQPESVRRLLLRTSLLERVTAPLADLLTGDSGGGRVLQDLEEAGAFVASVDGRRSWFRYHQLLVDLLQLELHRTMPDEVPGLHRLAATWFAENGDPIEATRHAQAAGDWSLAVRLLSDGWFDLWLGGKAASIHELLMRFPAGLETEPELDAMLAADELTRGSIEEAEGHLARGSQRAESCPEERRGRLEAWMTLGRLGVARRRGDLEAAVDEAERVLALIDAPDAPEPAIRDEQRAMALVELGTAEAAAARTDDAEGHLERALILARRSEQPFLEVSALSQLGKVAVHSSFRLASERTREAIELARRHGWSDQPVVADAYTLLGLCAVVSGRLDEAESSFERAEGTLPPDGLPATEGVLHFARALLALTRGRDHDALAAVRAGERTIGLLVAPERVVIPRVAQLQRALRALRLQVLVRLGATESVELALENMANDERESPEMRIALAALRLAQGEPASARAALGPALDQTAAESGPGPVAVQARLLAAIADDALRDAGAAGRALESALDTAEREAVLLPFLLHPAPSLLERHQRHHTSHAALVADIRALLAGRELASLDDMEPPAEPLSESEIRVLRYLPTNLSAPEIAAELYLSVSTIKTHIQHVYGKLGVHSRAEAVERARALGLLAPSSLAIH